MFLDFSKSSFRVKAKVFIRISINATTVGFVSTRIITEARFGFGNGNGFMADEFKAFGAVFATANAGKDEGSIINGT